MQQQDTVIDKMITEAMKRTYATEFVANNSQAAMNCMKALSWLVERNTTMSGDNGVYKTTAETDEKKVGYFSSWWCIKMHQVKPGASRCT